MLACSLFTQNAKDQGVSLAIQEEKAQLFLKFKLRQQSVEAVGPWLSTWAAVRVVRDLDNHGYRFKFFSIPPIPTPPLST